MPPVIFCNGVQCEIVSLKVSLRKEELLFTSFQPKPSKAEFLLSYFYLEQQNFIWGRHTSLMALISSLGLQKLMKLIGTSKEGGKNEI